MKKILFFERKSAKIERNNMFFVFVFVGKKRKFFAYFAGRAPNSLFPFLALFASFSKNAKENGWEFCFANANCEESANIFGYFMITVYFVEWLILLFICLPRFIHFHYILWHIVSWQSDHNWLMERNDKNRDFMKEIEFLYFGLVMENEVGKIVKEMFGKGVGGIIMSYVSGSFDDKMKEYYAIEKAEDKEMKIVSNRGVLLAGQDDGFIGDDIVDYGGDADDVALLETEREVDAL